MEQKLVDPAVFGSHLQDFPAVAVNPFLCRVHFPNGLAAAAELPRDGNNDILHESSPFIHPDMPF